MKKVSISFLTIVLISVLSNISAFAADFTMSFDFNDYEAAVSSGVAPSGWSYYSAGAAFGSDSGALKINYGGKPALHFTDPIECKYPKDAIHISFRAKITGSLRIGTVKNNKNHNEDITKVSMNNRARYNLVQITPKAVSWDKVARDHGCSTYSWTRPSADTGWHRYDMVRAADGSWTFYVDGVNIMGAGTCKEHQWNDNGGTQYSWLFFTGISSSATIDDVKVRVQKSKLDGLSLTQIGNERVERDNGVLKIALSEPVTSASLVKEAFTISNNVTGETVTDFVVEPDDFNGSADTATIKFGPNTLTSGDYTVTIDTSVKGAITGTSAQSGVVFKPAYKKFNGVIYPEAEEIKFLGIDGEPIELSDNMNAGLKEIVVKFNTIIDDTDIESYVVLKDEKGVVEDLGYNVTNEGQNSILTISIENLLKPYEAYTFTISKGIPAKENTEVKSENDDEYRFKTSMPDQGGEILGISRSEVVIQDNKYYFSIAKTNEASVKLWAVAAAYKTVKDEEGNEFDLLLELKCIPVVLDSDDKGTFDYEAEFENSLSSSDIVVKTYIREYPSLLPSSL